MKYILLIIALIISYKLYDHYSNDNIQVSFNTNGLKLAQATCEKEKECLFEIGKICEEAGYNIEAKETTTNKNNIIITATCKKQDLVDKVNNLL